MRCLPKTMHCLNSSYARPSAKVCNFSRRFGFCPSTKVCNKYLQYGFATANVCNALRSAHPQRSVVPPCADLSQMLRALNQFRSLSHSQFVFRKFGMGTVWSSVTAAVWFSLTPPALTVPSSVVFFACFRFRFQSDGVGRCECKCAKKRRWERSAKTVSGAQSASTIWMAVTTTGMATTTVAFAL